MLFELKEKISIIKSTAAASRLELSGEFNTVKFRRRLKEGNFLLSLLVKMQPAIQKFEKYHLINP